LPVPAVTSCVLRPGHVIQPPASWFHPSRFRTLLREAGFDERAWLPLTPDERAPATATSARVLSAPTVVHGPDALAMEAASRRNQAEQRVINLRRVFVRG
jgi:hypothetical protein